MSLVHCPICQKQFSSDESPAMPFCSERCRLLDLGRWLDERYGLEEDPEAKPDEPADES
jgi:uncharacterized protein